MAKPYQNFALKAKHIDYSKNLEITNKMIKSLIKRYVGPDKYYYSMVKRIFGITPDNIEVYKLALVHRSASVVIEDIHSDKNERKKNNKNQNATSNSETVTTGTVINNERLEFLGDAVIEAIISEMLFIDYPDMNEGHMTKLRSKLVSRETLNQLAIDIGLSQEIIAQGSIISNHKQNLYGDAFEAMIGALYLDKGYNKTNRILIHRIIGRYVDIEKLTNTERDFKSRMIEWAQKNRRRIEFATTMAADHSEYNPSFETILKLENGGQHLGYGSGHSKKESEQRAAKQAFLKIEQNQLEIK